MHADVSDPESLRRVAAKTAVILTSIGPYTKYGEAVVVACIEERAHYVDITGELWWVAEMRAKYGERARAAGVCIVSFAGYDCVPFELSALLAHKTLMKGGERLASMECLTKFDGGGFPPGTMLTLLNIFSIGFSRTLLGCAKYIPASERWSVIRDLVLLLLPSWSRQKCGLTVMEGMGAVGCCIVHSSAPVLGYPGVAFNSRFDLPLGGGASPLAFFTLWGIVPVSLLYACAVMSTVPVVLLSIVLLYVPPVRDLIAKLIPKFGYKGNLGVTTTVRGRGIGANGNVVNTKLVFMGDAGIYLTAQCACETALAMVHMVDMAHMVERIHAGSSQAPLPAGFTTPGPAVGEALLVRLACAGVVVEAG
jgi:short subunit dehydrogenase-like uncharacterized protein